MKKAIIFAIVLKVILLSITAHSDLWDIVIASHLFADKGIFNIYDFYLSLPKDHNLVKSFTTSFFPYPPLTLYTFAIWTKIISPFTSQSFLDSMTNNLFGIYNRTDVIWHIFWYKLIYLFFDLGTGYLIWKYFKSLVQKRLALLLWLFNPLSYYLLALGNLDLIPTFFAVLGLYLASRKRLALACLAIGVGGAYKFFGLLFLPLMLLIPVKNNWNKIYYLFLGLAPIVFTIWPFLNSAGFEQMVLFSPYNLRILESKIFLAEDFVIFPVITILLMYYLFFFFKAQTVKLWQGYLSTLLILFSLIKIHVQWFLWVTPFIVIELVLSKLKNFYLPAILFGCWLIILMFSSADLSVGLFIPLKTLGLFQNVTPQVTQTFTPSYMINPQQKPGIDLQNLARSLFFAATSIYLLIINNLLIKKTIFK
ncbi:hypothetical protein HYS93_01420 [Candidatus Daviesbacteria bacterium]|nr:hypothetical protein [Candidatus Daviesbacteria bacterium]